MSEAFWGVIIALSMLGIAISTIIFNVGKQASRSETRIESLESWRVMIRQDLHEVSDSLEAINRELGQLSERLEAVKKTLDTHDSWERSREQVRFPTKGI